MKENRKIRVGITHGDTNGIGYEVILKALADDHVSEICTPVIYGSTRVASYYRKGLNLPQMQMNIVDSADGIADDRINLINVLPDEIKVEPGKASAEAGHAAFVALERAVADLRDGSIDALVTAPIDKSTIQSPTFAFPGHTEYLEASLREEGADPALMILFNDVVRVALATTHLPVSKIAENLTTEGIRSKIRTFARSLTRDFGIHAPRLAVLALNPHAGDGGLLGHEEAEIIAPAIEQCYTDDKISVFGPYPADSFFGKGLFKKFDGVLAMYHDQGLAPFKTLAGDAGVNFTAGLDFVRTSPDHGTGYDIAGHGVADPASMRHAIYEAVDIVQRRDTHRQITRNPLRRQYVERNKHDNVVLDLTKDD